jgi:putative protease
MCISQSSQCYLSGILFGESSNCGRCMKPCRWNWKLALRRGKTELPGEREGHLLARKDMCLLPHVPALVQNDIASLKIEGRMRTAEFLAPVVALYRRAIDTYFEDPVHYTTNAKDMQTLFSQRVRELTTAHSFGNPGSDGVDISGKREPRFFSHAAPALILTTDRDINPESVRKDVELIVHVSNLAGAEAALDAGADAIYFCGDGFHLHGGVILVSSLTDFAHRAAQNGTRLGAMMPHICDERDMDEWRQRLPQVAGLPDMTIGVSNLGGLQLARDHRYRNILADYPLNVTNSVAADELSTLGASRITGSVELTFEQLAEFASGARMPIEFIAQGPVCGMLLEHCVLASAGGENPQDLCSMRCRQGAYALDDTSGQSHPLECDRRCRNHVFTPSDVCVLPNLARILALGISGLRIEAQLDAAETVRTLTGIYRNAIDCLKTGQTIEVAEALTKITDATQRPLSDGPFDFRTVGQTSKEERLART